MGNAHPQGGPEVGLTRSNPPKHRGFGKEHGLAKSKQHGEDSSSNGKSSIPRNYSFGGTPEDFDSSLANLAFASTTTHKGLSNNSGDNNCFLNSTIQALWHLGPFRVELQDFVATHSYLIDARYQQNLINNNNNSSSASTNTNTSDGSCGNISTGQTGNDDLLRALCNMFNQYEFSEDAVVSPDELRNVISHVYDKFRVGDIADANETLEAILDRIHSEWTPACPCKDGSKCIGHTVFGGLLMEQAVCQLCGASSEPMLRSDFVHYVYAAELISLAEEGRRAALGQSSAASAGGGNSVKRFLKGLSLGNKHGSTGGSSTSSHTQRTHVPRINFSPGGLAQAQGLAQTQPAPGGGVSQQGSGLGSHETGSQTLKHNFATTNSTLAQVTGAAPPSLGNLPGTHFGRLLRQCLAVSPLSCPSVEDAKEKEKRLAKEKQENLGQGGAGAAESSYLSAGGREGYGHVPPPPPPSLNLPPPPGPPPCQGKALVSIHALEAPLALAISVGWTQAKESPETLQAFLDLLSYRVQLADLFDLQSTGGSAATSGGGASSTNGHISGTTSPFSYSPTHSSATAATVDSTNQYHDTTTSTSTTTTAAAQGPSYVFRGFVGYYGLHYISVFQDKTNAQEGQFLLFDDTNIRMLGGWEDVKRQCIRSHLQPVLLLYELEQSADAPHTPRKGRSLLDMDGGDGGYGYGGMDDGTDGGPGSGPSRHWRGGVTRVSYGSPDSAQVGCDPGAGQCTTHSIDTKTPPLSSEDSAKSGGDLPAMTPMGSTASGGDDDGVNLLITRNSAPPPPPLLHPPPPPPPPKQLQPPVSPTFHLPVGVNLPGITSGSPPPLAPPSATPMFIELDVTPPPLPPSTSTLSSSSSSSSPDMSNGTPPMTISLMPMGAMRVEDALRKNQMKNSPSQSPSQQVSQPPSQEASNVLGHQTLPLSPPLASQPPPQNYQPPLPPPQPLQKEEVIPPTVSLPTAPTFHLPVGVNLPGITSGSPPPVAVLPPPPTVVPPSDVMTHSLTSGSDNTALSLSSPTSSSSLPTINASTVPNGVGEGSGGIGSNSTTITAVAGPAPLAIPTSPSSHSHNTHSPTNPSHSSYSPPRHDASSAAAAMNKAPSSSSSSSNMVSSGAGLGQGSRPAKATGQGLGLSLKTWFGGNSPKSVDQQKEKDKDNTSSNSGNCTNSTSVSTSGSTGMNGLRSPRSVEKPVSPHLGSHRNKTQSNNTHSNQNQNSNHNLHHHSNHVHQKSNSFGEAGGSGLMGGEGITRGVEEKKGYGHHNSNEHHHQHRSSSYSDGLTGTGGTRNPTAIATAIATAAATVNSSSSGGRNNNSVSSQPHNHNPHSNNPHSNHPHSNSHNPSSNKCIPRIPIDKWARAPRTYHVTLRYALVQGRRLLGMEHGYDPKTTHTIVVSFPRGPNNMVLPVEACRLVSLQDRILAIEGAAIVDGPDSQRQVRSMFEECSKSRETITLTLASSAQTSLWITCPYCNGYTPVGEEDLEVIKRYAVGPAAVAAARHQGQEIYDTMKGQYHCRNTACGKTGGTEFLVESGVLYEK